MAVIEITAFALADGVDEAAFLEADRRVQTEFIPNHAGFARRTTARSADGAWIVIVLWASTDNADASASLAETDPVATTFAALLDPRSIRHKRYSTLD